MLNSPRVVRRALAAFALTAFPLFPARGNWPERRHRGVDWFVLNFGRDPQLKLLNSEASEVSLEQLAAPIMDAMSEAAAWLDQCGQTNRHRDAVAMANSRVLGTAETLSGRMLRELGE